MVTKVRTLKTGKTVGGIFQPYIFVMKVFISSLIAGCEAIRGACRSAVIALRHEPVWLMDGTEATFVGAVGPFNPGANWQIQGTGDFNDDGKDDILWLQETGGLVAEWHMDGTNTTFVGAVGMSQAGSPLFTGKFNNGDELDWSVYSKTDSYEAVFGVDAHGNLDGDQLLAVLNQPAQSNASPINLEVPLAKQAVTALLNATNDADGAVTQHFRFGVDDVIGAVKKVYDGAHSDTAKGADLTGLLAFWNAAPAANRSTSPSSRKTQNVAGEVPAIS